MPKNSNTPTTDNQPADSYSHETAPADDQASELDALLANYRAALHPIFEDEDAAWKAKANRERLINATEAAKAAISRLLREATPDFMKPGAIIPYETINGKEWVSLDWLTAQLRKQSKKER